MKKFKAVFTSICMLLTLTSCVGSTGNAGGGSSSAPDAGESVQSGSQTAPFARLLYMGHASLRITTPENKVIYIDPYAGSGYEPAADLILVTHGHFDHTATDKITSRAPDCRTVTWKEALVKGKHMTFDLGFASVKAVEAGFNRNHNAKECVGYIVTLSDGVKIYVSGDTSKTGQMAELASENIDYAFYCCDGVYNMDLREAAECAKLVGAKHDVPYHVIAASGDRFFDRERAEKFDSPNLLVIDQGEEIELHKN